MSSPSAHAELGSIVSAPPVTEPDLILDQLSRKDSRTYSSSSLTPPDTSSIESQLVPTGSSGKGSPAYSQSSRANDPSTVAQQVVLYLAGEQDDEDDRDVRRPSSSPARAIVDWLATAGSAATCTRDRKRVRGNQTPVPRPPGKKVPATVKSKDKVANDTKTLHDDGDRRNTRSSAKIKSDSMVCDNDRLLRNANLSSMAQGSSPDKGSLDGYTVDLLKDVLHALERVKGSLGDSSSLPALVPTLTLLEEGFDSLPRPISEPMLSTVCSMLQRIKVQCLRKAKLHDAAEIRSAVWYTQTLVDRTLSCIKALIDVE
ncbi:Zn(2)-C6 fungal-type domain-containing protein [Pseudozyma hubeiensis]|nr:Zn(2)-C6 fungal-type domain-containing protein [Pseudozyma hubeiensis]